MSAKPSNLRTSPPVRHPAGRAPLLHIGEPVHVGALALPGELAVPADAAGLVLFAHGSGCHHDSPPGPRMATFLHRHGLATLAFDLLTEAEAGDRHRVFDVELLAERLADALDWAALRADLRGWHPGLFGVGVGAAAALAAAAARPSRVGAVVGCCGRPDLAGAWLPSVLAPTLLIVGDADDTLLTMNRLALRQLGGRRRLEVVPRVSERCDEPGARASLAALACAWFQRCLPARH